MELERRTVSEWKETLIVPVGDIQWSPEGRGIDTKTLKRTLQSALEHDGPVLFLGMGDMVDFPSPSNRAKLTAGFADGSLYDSAQEHIDFVAERVLEELFEILEPTVGMWLGLLQGHHFHLFSDGTTSDNRLCQRLKAPYLGDNAFVEVRWAQKDPTKKRRSIRTMPSIVIWCHHGRGGGKMAGNALNQLQGMIQGFDADIYLQGHHHRQSATKVQRIKPFFGTSNAFLERKDIILGVTGGYLRGYQEGSKSGGRAGGTYVEKAMMNPVSMGGITITATPYQREGIVPAVRLKITI